MRRAGRSVRYSGVLGATLGGGRRGAQSSGGPKKVQVPTGLAASVLRFREGQCPGGPGRPRPEVRGDVRSAAHGKARRQGGSMRRNTKNALKLTAEHAAIALQLQIE